MYVFGEGGGSGDWMRGLGLSFTNPVAPYGYLLPTVYLFMADIVNPDLFACGRQT